LRTAIRCREEQGRQSLRDTGGALIRLPAPDDVCSICRGPTTVRKTYTRGGTTLAHGRFRIRLTERVCATGCRQDGKLHVSRSTELDGLLLPRSTVGYDVMTFVGTERYVHFRQREEIRLSLAKRWGLEISSGEVSALAAKFCVYLAALHQARADRLRSVLAADGGWPMHVDSTGEDGQGTLLVIYCGWRQWVLGAWKIPTERAEAILPRMIETARLFGAPCAVMRDLGRAVIEATKSYIATLPAPIPNLGCHMHLVRDIGKDLLRAAHEGLRALFRRFGIIADLRALARDLGRRLGPGLDEARAGLVSWLEADDAPYLLPSGNHGLATVRALVQWVLDFAADGHDEGFPFDRPWLDLHARCLRACRGAEAFLVRPHDDDPAYQALARLFRIVSTVRSEVPFGRQAAILAARARLLDELRDALRLRLKENGRNPQHAQPSSPALATAELRDIEAGLEELIAALHQRRPDRGPAQDTRQAIDIILDHLERHGPSLHGHQIALPDSLGGGVRVVERTNVILESFFHRIKHGERRRSGRKTLAQDLEHLPPEAALARNLTRADYVNALCGSLDRLPAAFAELDVGNRALSLSARTRKASAAVETVTRSMTSADRKLVRTRQLVRRVEAAAGSRSVRLSA
jgi:hypothetical protein